jgi:hypothetical protein
MENKSYNPLDKHNLGTSVADALLESQALPLGSIEPFPGAGIYAIYYTGTFEAYAPLADLNRDGTFRVPIYVGKAVPPGARKGNFGLDVEPGPALFNRLKEHAESIKEASNLNIDHFHCRLLVVDDIWIPLGESLLIAKFCPIWNKFIDGFGNHDPGKGRYQQARSRWDTLHPGRGWAAKCLGRNETADQIEAELPSFLKHLPMPACPNE